MKTHPMTPALAASVPAPPSAALSTAAVPLDGTEATGSDANGLNAVNT